MFSELRDEIAWLEELEGLCRSARTVSLRTGREVLEGTLVRKTELLGALDKRKQRRISELRAAGLGRDDVLTFLLNQVDGSRRGDVHGLLADYAAAARRVAREVEKSRDFYEVALGALQESLDSLYRARDAAVETYSGEGASEDARPGVWVSRLA